MSTFDTLTVVKRSGQRTSFQGEKIALAIQKAFHSLDIPYKDEDVNKVYSKVLKKIEKEYKDRKTINIENIQDLIEEVLKENNFEDVYLAFSTYREHRNASRSAFVMKQQHKFLKAIERLGLDNIDDNLKERPNSFLLQFGETISSEFAKAYLLDTKTVRYQDAGIFNLHSIETIPFGMIATCDVDLIELATLDTDFAKELNSINKINTYLNRIKLYLDSLSKEVYQSISLINFDLVLKNVILKEFKSILKEYIDIYLDANYLTNYLTITGIDNITSFDITPAYFAIDNNTPLYLAIATIIKKAKLKCEKNFTSSLKTFFKTISFPLAINFGTNNSTKELIIKSLVNNKYIEYYYQGEMTEEIATTMLNYSNLYFINKDASFNKAIKECVNYGYNSLRVIEDNTTIDKKIIGGKGNISCVSINLVRIALKSMNIKTKETDYRLFYQELEKVLKQAKDALLERFELQVDKTVLHFPTLYQLGTWHDGEKLKNKDRLRKLLKHGTLAFHIVGLSEAIYTLTGNKDEEITFNLAKDILKFMQKKIDNYSEQNNLNFVLTTYNDNNIETEFKKQDAAIFGKIKDVTNKDKYSEGITLPISDLKQASLQKYLLGGSSLEIVVKDEKQLLNKYQSLKNNNIGCFNVKRKELPIK